MRRRGAAQREKGEQLGPKEPRAACAAGFQQTPYPPDDGLVCDAPKHLAIRRATRRRMIDQPRENGGGRDVHEELLLELLEQLGISFIRRERRLALQAA